jgi:hypothetical protein
MLYNFLQLYFINVCYKLEVLSLASLSSLLKCFRVSSEPSRGKILKVFYSMAGFQPIDNRRARKVLPGTNTQAYNTYL